MVLKDSYNEEPDLIEQTEGDFWVFIWQHKFFALFTLVFVVLPLIVIFGKENIAEITDIILRQTPELKSITSEKYINLYGAFLYTFFFWTGIMFFRKSLAVTGSPGAIALSFFEIFNGFFFVLSPFWFPPLFKILLRIMM